MVSTRSAASRKRNSTTNALDILNTLNKRTKTTDDRETQSARPVRQLRNVPRTPRRDIYDIPRSESLELPRRPIVQLSPTSTARPLNPRYTPVLEDIWGNYKPTSFPEYSQSSNTESSPLTAPEPTRRRQPTRLNSVQNQSETQSSLRRTPNRIKRREVDYPENEEYMEEGDSWQSSFRDGTDNESASETGDRNSLAGEENDLLQIDLFSNNDGYPSPSAQQLGQTLEQSGQYESAQSSPNMRSTPQRVPDSGNRRQSVAQSSSRSYRFTPRAAVPSPSVVVRNSPNKIPETPLSRRSTRSRPAPSQAEDDDGDRVMGENALKTVARDGDVDTGEDEDSAEERGDNVTRFNHEAADLSNLNDDSDSSLFVRQDFPEPRSLPDTQSGEIPQPANGHDLRLGGSVAMSTSVSRETPEASGPDGQPSPQDAPNRPRRSGRLNTVSTANTVSLAQEPSATPKSRSPDALDRRRRPYGSQSSRPCQPSPRRPRGRPAPEEPTGALASRQIRGRRSRIVYSYTAHQNPEPESSYPQCKEAMKLGQQQRNWKILIREAHKMGVPLDSGSTERFKDAIDLIEYLRQWYEDLHQRSRPAQGICLKDIRKHEEMLDCILSEGNLLLDYVHDTVIKRENRERGRKLFERFEACVIPGIIELVFAIFDAYHLDPKRSPGIYHHLRRALTLLRDLCERMTILAKDGYVRTKTRTENLLRPLQKLIKASESGLLQNIETDSLDLDVEVIESTDEDTPVLLSRRPWTDAEGIALMDGLIKHQGPRRYTLIMRDFADKLKGRTISELRDKAQQAYTLYKPRIQGELRTIEGREKWQWLVSVQE
ncbi:hypothetical protein BDV10DRAFT_168319 [Aspergillus recurvatus]